MQYFLCTYYSLLLLTLAYQLYQLINFLLLVASFTVFEILLAIQLDDGALLPYYSAFLAAFVVEILLFTCGLGMGFGRNHSKSLFPAKPNKRKRKTGASRGGRKKSYHSVPSERPQETFEPVTEIRTVPNTEKADADGSVNT